MGRLAAGAAPCAFVRLFNGPSAKCGGVESAFLGLAVPQVHMVHDTSKLDPLVAQYEKTALACTGAPRSLHLPPAAAGPALCPAPRAAPGS